MNRDQERLKTLSVFHYIVGVMYALFSFLPLIHVILGIIMLVAPESMKGNSGPPPAAAGWVFVFIGGFFILVGWCFALSLILAGRFLIRRKNYLFCMIVAGVSCLFVPIGTILGIFTLINLSKESVKELFKPKASSAQILFDNKENI
ncbi:MAG: hypothetical protein JW734_00265 [Candidatus Omnitrophica bacterium]|nr:hypothetical protein [Candidatus Omnitrophota bacterium]